MPRRLLLAALSGLLLVLAHAPFEQPWTLPLGIAGLAVLCHRRPPGRAALLGLAFGAAYMFSHLFWMRAVGPDAWLALAGVEALFFAPIGAVFALVSRLPAWPVWAAVSYVGIDHVRGGWPFSGMPWGRPSYATVDSPWEAALPWVGHIGVSLLLVLVGTSLAWLALRWRSRGTTPGSGRGVPAWGAVAVVLGVVALGLVPNLFRWQPPEGAPYTVAAVQGDVPGDGTDVLADHRQVTANHVDATLGLAREVDRGDAPRPDLVVWPENSTAVDPFADVAINAGIEEAVEAVGVPVLVGAMVDAERPDAVLNQGVVWRPGVGPGDRYTKWHPVPFGEYIPWRDTVFPSNFGRLEMIHRDMVAGTRQEPLQVGDALVSDAICFDVAYDDGIHAQVGAGAGLVVVQTSNAMFINTSQIEQQFAITRLRAIETGKYVVVASVNGVSGVIAPDGTVVARAGTREQEVLVEEIRTHDAVTPAVRMGAWPGDLAVALGMVGAASGALKYRRRNRPTGAPARSVAAPERAAEETDRGVGDRVPATPGTRE